jgi:AcrR family transcriptional regulator
VDSGGHEAIEDARRAAQSVLTDADVRFEGGEARPLGERGRRTRASILRAAGESFVDLGWGATTIGTIAERAGVGTGTLYQYFRAKEDVLAALVGEWVLGALETLRGWDPHDGRPGLEQVIGRFVRGYAATSRFQAVWEELTNVEPTLTALRLRLTDAYVAVFAEAFTQGAADGILDAGDEPAEVARALCAMADRYCHQRFVLRPDERSPEQVTALLTDLWAAAIRLR